METKLKNEKAKKLLKKEKIKEKQPENFDLYFQLFNNQKKSIKKIAPNISNNHSCKDLSLKKKKSLSKNNYLSHKKFSVESLKNNHAFLDFSKIKTSTNDLDKEFKLFSFQNLKKQKDSGLKKEAKTINDKNEKTPLKNRKTKSKLKNLKKKLNFGKNEKNDQNKNYHPTLKKKLYFCKSDQKKKVKMVSKNENLNKKLKQINIKILFQNEKYLFDFFNLINQEKNFYDIFKNYMDFIQNENFSFIFESYYLNKDKNYLSSLKKLLIMERASFLICFYFLISDLYTSEVVFFKKLVNYLYCNFLLFFEGFLKNYFSQNSFNSCKNEIEDFLQRKDTLKINSCEDSFIANNKRILKYIIFELKHFKDNVPDSILKVIEFSHDFSIEESTEFLVKIFSKLVF